MTTVTFKHAHTHIEFDVTAFGDTERQIAAICDCGHIQMRSEPFGAVSTEMPTEEELERVRQIARGQA